MTLSSVSAAATRTDGLNSRFHQIRRAVEAGGNPTVKESLAILRARG